MLRFSSLWQTWHFFALWANTRSSGSRTSAEPSLQDKRHSESLKNRTRANLFSPLQLPALFWTFRSGCPKTGTPDAGTNRLLHSHNATDCWCPLLQRRRKRIWRGEHWVAETGLCQVVRLPSVGDGWRLSQKVGGESDCSVENNTDFQKARRGHWWHLGTSYNNIDNSRVWLWGRAGFAIMAISNVLLISIIGGVC